MSLSSEDLDRLHREALEAAREAYNAVVGQDGGHKMTVGKHEAKNHAHLKSVIEEADAACPRAADTLRWLLWHRVLEAQRMAETAAEGVGEESLRPKPVFRYAHVEGGTREEMRANARKSRISDYGDAVIVVINEGDLFRGECIEGERDLREPVKVDLKLSSADFPAVPAGASAEPVEGQDTDKADPKKD
jgi:IMP dehydrogenase/GMP reductase